MLVDGVLLQYHGVGLGQLAPAPCTLHAVERLRLASRWPEYVGKRSLCIYGGHLFCGGPLYTI